MEEQNVFLVFLLCFVFNYFLFSLGGCYTGEGQIQRDWEMSRIAVRDVKFQN